MPFPIPGKYSSEAADVARDERKRRVSPPSFFFAQTQALLLSAGYFKNDRLVASARGAVANKHRNRIRSALFGQVMASFEFCVKDFVAQVIDSSDVFDEAVNQCKWIDVDKSRILAQRDVAGSVGAMLIHPLLGWHDTEEMNRRFETLFQYRLLDDAEAQTLQRLWIIRHSVAHNGGFVTHHDAYRLQAPSLREAAMEMDLDFLHETVTFLRTIVLKLEHDKPIADAILGAWIRRKATGVWPQDKVAYSRVRAIVTVIRQRTQDLPKVTKGIYSADRRRLLDANP
jgi:hypothetical protein